jgi:thiosulfate/3-mercaptopyruvate sulfurtransferase
MKRNGSLCMVLVAVFMVSLIAGPVFAGYKGFERGDALISPEELKQLIDAGDKDLVIIAVAQGVSYKAGHIADSLQVWRSDYQPPANKPFAYGGMILNRAEFQTFARALGVNNDSKVVLYDEKYDATRLWWAFYLYGKTDCRVLDGGYQGWKAAGYDVEMSILDPTADAPGNFTAGMPLQGWLATMYDVYQASTNVDYQLWDTRENDEWTGAKLKKGAFRQGRIPWAKFLNWKEFKTKVVEDAPPTAFKSAADVQKVIDKYGMDKNKRQIFYCQSGVRTTTEMFALYLMGWDSAVLGNYDGSWIEWSYFDKNPIEKD